MLAWLAAVSVMASALPDPERTSLAALALLLGLAGARRVASEPTGTLEWAGGDAAATFHRDGRPTILIGVSVEFRGPVVRLQGRDGRGRIHRLVWWPDTLPPGSRRLLLLAARAGHRSDIFLPAMAA